MLQSIRKARRLRVPQYLFSRQSCLNKAMRTLWDKRFNRANDDSTVIILAATKASAP